MYANECRDFECFRHTNLKTDLSLSHISMVCAIVAMCLVVVTINQKRFASSVFLFTFLSIATKQLLRLELHNHSLSKNTIGN